MIKYVLRLYAGWAAYEPMIAECVIFACNDDVALEKAAHIAAGQAFTVNRMA